jgi:hypothetical protein
MLEPCAAKACAAERAAESLTRVRRGSEELPLGHPIDLKAKAVGEKSMSEKRESLEDAEGVVLQGPCDMAKAKLPEP